MTPQNAFGDDQGAERDQRSRDHRQIVEHPAAAPPRHAAYQEQQRDDAERDQKAPGQRAPGITPVERDHGDAEADRAAQIDDGIRDHARCHGPAPFAGVRGRKMPKGRVSSIQ